MSKADSDYQMAIDGLTPKQRKYAKALLNPDTESQAEAYREAYNVSPEARPKSSRDEASRMAKHPGVAAAVDAGRAVDRERELAASGTRRRWVLSRLVTEAEGATSDSARVRALELLARTSGLFDTALDRSDSRASADEDALLSELQDRLSRYFPGVDVSGTGEVVDLPADED